MKAYIIFPILFVLLMSGFTGWALYDDYKDDKVEEKLCNETKQQYLIDPSPENNLLVIENCI